MASDGKNLILVFDGDCAFCTLAVRVLKTLDVGGRVTTVPYQFPGACESAGLPLQQCGAAAWSLAPDGRRAAGAEALIAGVAWAIGLPRLSSAYYLPGLRAVAEAVYKWLARNRSRLPGLEPYCHRHPADCGRDRGT